MSSVITLVERALGPPSHAPVGLCNGEDPPLPRLSLLLGVYRLGLSISGSAHEPGGGGSPFTLALCTGLVGGAEKCDEGIGVGKNDSKTLLFCVKKFMGCTGFGVSSS